MRTSRDISTISYNTTDFLILKLKELQKAKVLSFWAFIEHLPEDDECKGRNHKHLFLVPSKMLQTDELSLEFEEFDALHPDKPLKCTIFRASKFADWYMYILHDKAYLAYKGLSRKFHYLHDEIKTSDSDTLYEWSRMIDMTSLTPYNKILEAQANGLTYREFFRRGGVPLPQIALFQRAWDLLLNDETYRDGRPNHAVMDNENNLIYPTIDIEDQIKMAESEVN